ncbi:T9SS type A sorting domain-containing protein [Chryseolinea sp. T2]|uniref:T9SS type A sorting domain-containing protein n=1 Tax=Chryseolinea sp. T2 TaxID=3129255 RepID=UPI00307876CB
MKSIKLQSLLAALFVLVGCNTEPDVEVQNWFNVYIYPNPVTEYVNLVPGHSGETSLEVIDSNGDYVLRTKVSGPEHINVNLSNHPSGVYHVVFINASETIVREFVKL